MHHARNGFLTAKGLEEADQRRLEFREGLAGSESSLYLDKVGSVSASMGPLVHWPDDLTLDEQHRRFLHGS